MSEAAIIALAQILIKYGPDAALAIANLFKSGTTIDQAIAALELAKTKTAQQYLDEAKAALLAANAIPAASPVALPPAFVPAPA